jgi:ParB/Sulfiredoxin domain
VELENVFFHHIDWEDTIYRLTYDRSLTTLTQSIQAIGLRNPPILQKKENDRLRIVAGYRRLRVLQKLNQDPVPCKIVSPETEEQDLLFYNFNENVDRGFNPVEITMVMKKLSPFLGETGLISKVLPLLNLPPKVEIVRHYMAAAELSPIFFSALAQGRLFPETIELVIRKIPSLTTVIMAVFIFLHWGFQKQKEFLLDLSEISKRGGPEPERFLFSLPVIELLQLQDWTPQQKGEALRKYFRTCLYPTLAETEKRFERNISQMGLDERTRIRHPPYFEGGKYNLEIKFSGSKELKESLEKMAQALEEGKLSQLP